MVVRLRPVSAIAETRLEEAVRAEARGPADAIPRLVSAYVDAVDHARERAAEAQDDELTGELSRTLRAHEAVLDALLQTAPDAARPGLERALAAVRGALPDPGGPIFGERVRGAGPDIPGPPGAAELPAVPHALPLDTLSAPAEQDLGDLPAEPPAEGEGPVGPPIDVPLRRPPDGPPGPPLDGLPSGSGAAEPPPVPVPAPDRPQPVSR